MEKPKKIISLVLFGILLNNKVFGQIDIQLVDFVTFPTDTHVVFDASKIKVKRFGRNSPHVMDGPLKVIKDMGNEIELIGELYERQGYEYRKSAFKAKGLFCDMFNQGKLVLNQMVAYTDIPNNPFPCPLPVGTYQIRRLYPNITGLPPTWKSGDYMAKASYYIDGKFLQGVEVYMTVVNMFGSFMPK